MLLGHITDSAEVLHDPISAGRNGIRGAPGGSGPVPRLRGQLAALLASTAAASRSRSGTVSSRRAWLRSPVPSRSPSTAGTSRLRPLHGPACPGDELVAFLAGRSAAIPRGPPGLHK